MIPGKKCTHVTAENLESLQIATVPGFFDNFKNRNNEYHLKK